MKLKSLAALMMAGVMVLGLCACNSTTPDTSGSDSTPVSITTTESWDFSTGFYPAMSPATSNGTYGFTYYARNCYDILMIKQQHGYVRCVDVAEQLGVKKPSVSRAVKELIKSGHLVKNADGTLSLTELGLQIAEQIYEKHLFFTKQLILAGVDPETAEQDACGIEHAVSSESFQKLKKAFDDG